MHHIFSKIEWDSTNDDILNVVMANIERFRQFVGLYKRFVVVGCPRSIDLQNTLTKNLIVDCSKQVASMHGSIREEFFARYENDALESFVYDQSSPETLVIVINSDASNKSIERVLHSCAEELKPCLVISRSEPGIGNGKSFDFASKLFELQLESSWEQFEFAVAFLIGQITRRTGPICMTVIK